jgi:hypothetical protein
MIGENSDCTFFFVLRCPRGQGFVARDSAGFFQSLGNEVFRVQTGSEEGEHFLGLGFKIFIVI